MDILIKGMEMPKKMECLEILLFHDGYTTYRVHERDEWTSTKAIPIVHCKDCDNFHEETHLCTLWGSWTSEDGFCHKAVVLERTT